jgi:hypothetical protein
MVTYPSVDGAVQYNCSRHMSDLRHVSDAMNSADSEVCLTQQ